MAVRRALFLRLLEGRMLAALDRAPRMPAMMMSSNLFVGRICNVRIRTTILEWIYLDLPSGRPTACWRRRKRMLWSALVFGRIYNKSEARYFSSCPAPLGFLVAVMYGLFP